MILEISERPNFDRNFQRKMASTHQFAQGVLKGRTVITFWIAFGEQLDFSKKGMKFAIWVQWMTKIELIHSILPRALSLIKNRWIGRSIAS